MGGVAPWPHDFYLQNGLVLSGACRKRKAHRSDWTYASEEVTEGLFRYMWGEVCDKNISSLVHGAISAGAFCGLNLRKLPLDPRGLYCRSVLHKLWDLVGLVTHNGQKRHPPARAVTDLPPWATTTIKNSSCTIRKVDVPCREYFASRSACSLLKVRILGDELKIPDLPFDFFQEGIHGALALWALGRRG